MRKMKIDEFEKFLNQPDWSHDVEFLDTVSADKHEEDWDSDSEEYHIRKIPHTYGFAIVESTKDDIKVVYREAYSYDDYEPETLTHGTEGMDEVWTVEGVTVVDEYGDPIPVHELEDIFPDAFSEINYSTLQINKTTDIDIDEEETNMETYTLKIDNQPDIRFHGELVGKASSSDNTAYGSSYSGSAGRWTELYLYKTAKGRFICHQIGRTLWQGERDRFSGKVCDGVDEAIEFFGHGWLAKELYEDAGIDAAVTVE